MLAMADHRTRTADVCLQPLSVPEVASLLGIFVLALAHIYWGSEKQQHTSLRLLHLLQVGITSSSPETQAEASEVS